MKLQYINKYPYKYLLDSDIEYNEPAYREFIAVKNEVILEYIDYTLARKIDKKAIEKDVEALIVLVDNDKLDFATMRTNMVLNKYFFDLDSNTTANHPPTTSSSFYQWKAAVQAGLNIQISDTITIIEAIHLNEYIDKIQQAANKIRQ